ncbi:hypothetical protein LRS06_14290 [Hymenobacter sp. J193]|uniref:hypothetical protein n=1 Tax=Hymenobacter sp. J193 TaxID=2898429 RepID=UPI002150AAE3|nr:hypothetical protein [Hymenobacter sp. J193]MCR5888914.1 hypothetical protein [Hymenobacter sp. J193]
MLTNKLGEYQILYLNAGQDAAWPGKLPLNSWLLLVLADEINKELFDQVTVECVKNRPFGLCCAGTAAHILEDWFDEEIVSAALRWEEKHHQPYDYDFAPVTTADSSIDEGLWFAATLAPNMAHAPIETIVCLDLTGQSQARIRELIPLLNSGWFPPDTNDND